MSLLVRLNCWKKESQHIWRPSCSSLPEECVWCSMRSVGWEVNYRCSSDTFTDKREALKQTHEEEEQLIIISPGLIWKTSRGASTSVDSCLFHLSSISHLLLLILLLILFPSTLEFILLQPPAWRPLHLLRPTRSIAAPKRGRESWTLHYNASTAEQLTRWPWSLVNWRGDLAPQGEREGEKRRKGGREREREGDVGANVTLRLPSFPLSCCCPLGRAWHFEYQ